MKRRQFLSTIAAGAATFAMPTILSGAERKANPMTRIGMTTAVFRFHFPQETSDKRRTPHLDWDTFPAYARDRFGLQNIEINKAQLEMRDPAYLKDVRRKIERAKLTLTNIQAGDWFGSHASEDEEKRRASVEASMRDIDSAALLGSKCVRIMPGQDMSVEAAIRSYRELSEYATKRGVAILIENHGGMTSWPENIIRILDSVAGDVSPNIDFGSTWEVDRFEGIKALAPHLKHQTCAKVEYFDEDWNHPPFDFDYCVRLCEKAGFRGVYSGEQFTFKTEDMDYEKVADWIIEHVKANI